MLIIINQIIFRNYIQSIIIFLFLREIYSTFIKLLNETLEECICDWFCRRRLQDFVEFYSYATGECLFSFSSNCLNKTFLPLGQGRWIMRAYSCVMRWLLLLGLVWDNVRREHPLIRKKYREEYVTKYLENK